MLIANSWSWVILIAGAVVLWLFCVALILALCAAMADGDMAEVERARRERAALGRACDRDGAA